MWPSGSSSPQSSANAIELFIRPLEAHRLASAASSRFLAAAIRASSVWTATAQYRQQFADLHPQRALRPAPRQSRPAWSTDASSPPTLPVWKLSPPICCSVWSTSRSRDTRLKLLLQVRQLIRPRLQLSAQDSRASLACFTSPTSRFVSCVNFASTRSASSATLSIRKLSPAILCSASPTQGSPGTRRQAAPTVRL